MNPVTVRKRRTNIIEVVLAYDVSQDVITSQIRKGQSVTSELIAEWDVRFKTDGTDGTLILTLDDSVTSTPKVVNAVVGYMDLKRMSGGEPLPVFENALMVMFKEAVTE